MDPVGHKLQLRTCSNQNLQLSMLYCAYVHVAVADPGGGGAQGASAPPSTMNFQPSVIDLLVLLNFKVL